MVVWDWLTIISGAEKLEPFSIAMELGILLFNGLDIVGSKPLTALLGMKKEGVANKVWGVECRELRWLGLIFGGGCVGILATWIKWHLGDRIMA